MKLVQESLPGEALGQGQNWKREGNEAGERKVMKSRWGRWRGKAGSGCLVHLMCLLVTLPARHFTEHRPVCVEKTFFSSTRALSCEPLYSFWLWGVFR